LNQVGCSVMYNSTVCLIPLTGYTVLVNGTLISTVGKFQLSNGTWVTGTPIANCLYHNSSKSCTLCG